MFVSEFGDLTIPQPKFDKSPHAAGGCTEHETSVRAFLRFLSIRLPHVSYGVPGAGLELTNSQLSEPTGGSCSGINETGTHRCVGDDRPDRDRKRDLSWVPIPRAAASRRRRE